MDLVQTFFLALIQGITEFIPISSSAHLLLVPELLNWTPSGLAFDVAVHVGTLVAVILYLRKEITQIVPAWINGFAQGQWDAQGKLGWMVIIATIPVGLAGLLLGGVIELQLRSIQFVALATLLFGLLLGVADWQAKSNARSVQELRLKDTITIGLMQALALIPGTSRSGITMTAMLLLGFSRVAAARFSFLLAIPAIALPGILKCTDLISTENHVDWPALLVGVAVSATVALLSMHWFIKFVQRVGMMPFVLYRVILAGLIYWWLL